VTRLIVQQPGQQARWTLVNRLLTEWKPDGSRAETLLPDDDAVLAVMGERFGLKFPKGTRLPYQDKRD
jgi:arylamine N-acetyltransferase